MKKDLMQRNKDKGLTWDDVARAAAILKALPPAPVAIWFVDNERDWRELEQQIKTITVTVEDRPEGLLNAPHFPQGLPIRHFKKADLDPETEIIDSPSRGGGSMFTEEYLSKFKRVWPYICHFPGVWIEMSNGTYGKLETGKGLRK
jgi:hypothetical protein